MRRLRVSVEWTICTSREVTQQPIGKFYLVAAILTHNCTLPPYLENYLSNRVH